jgi:hypothetical protein
MNDPDPGVCRPPLSNQDAKKVCSLGKWLISVSRYKTAFPVARIKKIMQMDEEVGKVAQATPIVICLYRKIV